MYCSILLAVIVSGIDPTFVKAYGNLHYRSSCDNLDNDPAAQILHKAKSKAKT